MDTNILQQHFNDCGLRLQFVADNPRSVPFSQTPDDQSNIEKFFYADVLQNATPHQRFRMFLHANAESLMLGKNPHSRHILVQVQCESVKPFRSPESHTMLFGHDERQLFIVDTPGASTVAEALESLKPSEVRWAERRGQKVIRQGDWFFIPMPSEFEPPRQALRLTKAQIGGNPPNNTHRQNMRGHVAELQAILMRVFFVKGKRWNEYVPPGHYVTGKVRHPEHATVELTRWYHPVHNRPLPGWRFAGQTNFIGYID